MIFHGVYNSSIDQSILGGLLNEPLRLLRGLVLLLRRLVNIDVVVFERQNINETGNLRSSFLAFLSEIFNHLQHQLPASHSVDGLPAHAHADLLF